MDKAPNDSYRGLNDNDDPWIVLAVATARVLGEQKQIQGDRQATRRRTEEEKQEAQRAYVDYRLRELSAWERGLGIRN